MKNIKRILSLVLIIALTLSVALFAVSCSDETKETETEAKTEAPETESETVLETEAETEAETETEAAKYTYKVTVLDANGSPIAGVTVQLCDDSTCKLPAVTGEDGTASFTYDAPSNYHVTLKASGYDVAETYNFPEGTTEVVITLNPIG